LVIWSPALADGGQRIHFPGHRQVQADMTRALKPKLLLQLATKLLGGKAGCCDGELATLTAHLAAQGLARVHVVHRGMFIWRGA